MTAPTLIEHLDRIEQLHLASLTKRVDEGKPLSDAEWRRLEALQSRARPPGPAEAYRGCMAALEAAIAELRTTGRPVPRSALRQARNAAVLAVADHVWSGASAAAADLHVSVSQARNLVEASGQSAAGIIAKAPVYRHLWQRAEARLESRPAAAASPIDEALKQVRLDKQTRRVETAAIDAARQGLVEAVGRIRSAIRAACADALDAIAGLDRAESERRVYDLMMAAIARSAAPDPVRDPSHTQPKEIP